MFIDYACLKNKTNKQTKNCYLKELVWNSDNASNKNECWQKVHCPHQMACGLNEYSKGESSK